MKIDMRNSKKIQSQLLIIPVFEGEKEIPELLDSQVKELVIKVLKNSAVKGKIYENVIMLTSCPVPEYLLFAGCGKRGDSTLFDLRKVAGAVSKIISSRGVKDTGIIVRNLWNPSTFSSVWIEGLIHGEYRYVEFKTEKNNGIKDGLSRIVFYSDKEEMKGDILPIAERTEKIMRKVNEYRDIINAPSNYMTPSRIADISYEMAKKNRLKCKIHNVQEIKKLGMGGIMAVSSGSKQEPKFVELEYKPEKYKHTIVLVGKGVTFDSGGISIKPWEGMEKMKYDMAGAVAVIGTMDLLAWLKPTVRVVGLVPLVENLPGGSAYKPGDILKMYSKKTVEVISTDAEGRLILADALAYGLMYKPSAIIDIATLTGACVVALGHEAAGVLGTDRELIDKIKSAGEQTGERVWELPLWKEYEELMKSDHADIKNVGSREAGTIQGAIFLRKFVDNTPWAHIDIAGTAWHDNDKPHASAGATGWGIRLLTTTVINF